MTAILSGLLSSMLPKVLEGGAEVASGLLKDVGGGKIHSFSDFGRSLASRVGEAIAGDRDDDTSNRRSRGRGSYQPRVIAKNNDPLNRIVQTPQEKMSRGDKNMRVYRTTDTPAGMGSTANYLVLPKKKRNRGGKRKNKNQILQEPLRLPTGAT